MRDREALEHATPARRDREPDLAAIARARALQDEAPLRRTRDELDRAVVLDLQALGDAADRRRFVFRHAAKSEEELVLLRLDAHLARRALAEHEEAAQAIAHLGERAVFGVRDGWHGSNVDIYRVTIYLSSAARPRRDTLGAVRRLELALAALATIVSVVVATRLRLSSDLTDLFPSTREAAALARVTRVTGGGDVSLVLVRGEDPAEVERAADDAAARLRAQDAVERVVTGPPAAREPGDPTAAWRWAGPVARRKLAQAVSDDGMRQRLRDTRALLLAPGASEAEEWLVRDPLRLALIPFEDRIELASGARAAPGDAFGADEGRARLLVVVARGRAFDAATAKRFTDEARAALDAAARPGVRLALTGGHVVASETEAMLRADLTKSGVLSTVLASLAFVALFRRPRALVAVLPPLVAGTLWTTAIAALAFARLSAVATAFAAVVIGVGVDTGVHVYGKLLAARREGLAPHEAAERARRETWRPTLGAAIAAGAAFACLGLSDVAGMRQLGALCAAGEVLTAVAILVVVPPVGAWLERGAPPPPLRLSMVASLTSTRSRALAALGVAAAAVAAALAFGEPAIANAVVTGAPKLPALTTYAEIDATFGGTRGQLVVVSTGADARARADAVAEAAELLRARGAIAGFDALASIDPSPELQRMRLADRDRLDLPARRAALARALAEEGFAVEAFAPALDAFEHPTSTAADAPLDSSLSWLVRRHLADDLAVTYVRLTGKPAEDAEARATIRAADPEAILTGFADLESSLRVTLARDLPRIFGAALGMVAIVLALSLRRVSAVLLALAVLAVEIALVLLGARALGLRWHVYDALVLPVLLGITLDEALFLLEASRARPIDDALAEQAPLASATAITTAAGFGALVVCRFGGLRDLGAVGALGSTAGLLCALVLIPAVLRLRR